MIWLFVCAIELGFLVGFIGGCVLFGGPKEEIVCPLKNERCAQHLNMWA